jgi:hypothetical protein
MSPTIDTSPRTGSCATRRSADIVRDGIVLYELAELSVGDAGVAHDSRSLPNGRAEYLASVDEWLDLAHHAMSKGDVGKWRNKVAFNLHQAAETAYACYLLASTFYFPK